MTEIREMRCLDVTGGEKKKIMVQPDMPKKTVHDMNVACKLAQKTKYSINGV
jgi:hypothetical protein